MNSAPDTRKISAKSNDAESFQATIDEITYHMPVHKRLFSNIIHNGAVAASSDALGSTLARPNALLLGAIFSFVATLVFYLVAKNLGYALSGFESIGAFLIGWLIGLTYDFVKLMITGKH